MKPFCAIYSTFLQRAYDQVVHDVAIQRLPVRFAIDRAGLVGADGATHAGSFDLAYLGCLPGIVLMAPADEAELMHMVATAAAIDDRPSALPLSARRGHRASSCRTRGDGAARSARAASCARAAASRSCRSAPGWRDALKAADELAARGLSTTVADARFAKPLDTALIERLAREHEVLITIEEGSIGGFGATCCSIWRCARPARPRPEGAPDDACPTASSTTTRRREQYRRRPASTPRTSSPDRAAARRSGIADAPALGLERAVRG